MTPISGGTKSELRSVGQAGASYPLKCKLRYLRVSRKKPRMTFVGAFSFRRRSARSALDAKWGAEKAPHFSHRS
jgi:hypothetical protein